MHFIPPVGLLREAAEELDTWNDDDRMWFEELAAKMEFECGSNRHDAERAAFYSVKFYRGDYTRERLYRGRM